MHKITKGLKKKKKGKKSKRKEEELFKPEELENYRREHQGATETAAEKNEEWKKFLELTSGVDNVLKKTQGDLDRIKSTSFFQRKPTESEARNAEQLNAAQLREEQEREAQVRQRLAAATEQLGIVEVSESESEEENDDNVFDTAYIDAIAAGEVKLAYIPESPTDKAEGDDPFDTSIAERAILGPEVERKGKKLVPIGAAVEVLTGRVQLPTCATRAPSSRRQILKERDLLLGSFDDNLNVVASGNDIPKTLLDEDPVCLPDKPISLINPTSETATNRAVQETTENSRDIVSEFDVIANTRICEDPDDQEFEALAAESLSKTATVLQSLPVATSVGPIEDIEWNAFDEKKIEEIEVDPFDTTFAENILPGKTELRIIEQEILNDNAAFEFKGAFSIQITDSAGQKDVFVANSRVSENELNLIKPIHRDLLGGSNTDLTTLNAQPSQANTSDVGQATAVAYCDPFNTPDIDLIKQRDATALVKGLLEGGALSDDDFDPRGDEPLPKGRSVSRPDVLNISSVKSVSFDVASPKELDLLGVGEGGRIIKPLTPFYNRKNSVPEAPLEEDVSDPFDTSFALNIAPGRAELKVIESELFDPNVERELSLVDNDFDPRDDKKAEIDKVVEIIKDITNIKLPAPARAKADDLLAIVDDISVKVLTPGNENTTVFSELSYCDPFDTSAVACNILPGKTELRLLETELIESKIVESNEPVDLLENQNDIIIEKPLSPSGDPVRLSIEDQDDFDPFDTSIANNIQPGKAELKLLESEFPIRFCSTRGAYHSPHSTTSNPFLLDDDIATNDGSEFGDNPFLSSDVVVSSASATNPFAFDPMEDEIAMEPAQFDVTSDNKCVSSGGEHDFFATEAPLTSEDDSHAVASANRLIGSATTVPQKPVDLDLKYSHPGASSGPPRPPPPRAPPSKETQDLLMSVMGAMDATSSTLLDKIPPTRTPSPVSMRDLHSPSPTPDTNIGDLLDVSDRTAETVANKAEDFLLPDQEGVCDINQNPAITSTVQAKPSRPLPPMRPPKPAPPQKPPPPDILLASNTAQEKPKPDVDEEPDMFGVEAPQLLRLSPRPI
ncbi:hypothetical protein NQ318_009891 [Aromia moschata]|uniref:Protein stoned-A n=1 Tax=Aromia moschata TaxID=1265417 RepID=A0AAV8Y215_9CUCU|nr:hypothetical protein NQ318_009891 [Aromia moschata]